ncbi:Organelle RRM domain-containing protein 2, mitochondrial [Stylosanthes scabra]|uniref:Organelle RRM domain-containing protein 2, mitochondrial n=1 Tax=Stylosanthes scabra TaxID=79078 RepID=A0ABU6W8I9_9FABA|nr:Organelle RRM domain-containing protein 2, mitochondrial [Stylosanthes scabra]
MAMRAAASAAPRGLRRLFCTNTAKPSSSFPFIPPPSTGAQPARPVAEPNTNLFISGLSKRTTTEKLREEFSKFGEVVQARVVTDRVSGYSKGFGFVKYATLEDAAKGIEGMDGKFLDGWVIFAEYARPRPPPGQPVNDMPPHYGRQ